MTQPTNSPTDTTELCQHCLQETPHSVRIEIRTENEGSENAALSREPYRITECQECETATDQRMNSI
ncbi:DUF7835 family putative zinc beta-ribbon protein [Haladaptatus litoreus]|nr:hypothetical protein [Haladaptatus litoreus]